MAGNAPGGGGGPPPQLRVEDVARLSMSQKDPATFWDIVMRVVFGTVIMGLFIWLNWSLFDLLRDLVEQDQKMVAAAGESKVERIINSQVIMALIAGTVAQVGAGAATILTYLFRRPTPTS